MFLSRLISVAPTEIEKMLLEQKETLRKLAEIKSGVEKLKLEQIQNSVKPIIDNMYNAGNTLQTPIFDMSNNSLIVKAERFFDYIDTTAKYITHPILIVNAIAGASYWVCLFVGIGGILFYMVGHKKGLKYTGGSILGYTLIQAINSGLKLL